MLKSQTEDLKNVDSALRKFNKMYDKVSSTYNINVGEMTIVRNYGQRILDFYNINFVEVKSRVQSLTNLLKYRG